MIILCIETPETGHFLQIEEDYFATNCPDNPFSFRVNGFVYLDEEDALPFLSSDHAKSNVKSIAKASIQSDVLDWTLVIFAAMQTQQMALNGQSIPEEFAEFIQKPDTSGEESEPDDFPQVVHKTLQ